MKPDVILFGELIPEAALTGSEDWARRADAVIIVGTSATVYPAADLPHLAREHGARIVECKRGADRIHAHHYQPLPPGPRRVHPCRNW
jgi:NAD-dependent deacetylase